MNQPGRIGIANGAQLHGKELSYNNILDITAAAELIAQGKKGIMVAARSDATAPVAAFDDRQISSGMLLSLRYLTRSGSSAARNPCPMRWAPKRTALQTDSAPAVSPAWGVR